MSFILGVQENIYKKVKKTHYMSAGEVGFGVLNIDIFLEVQNKRHSQILYLIDYIVIRSQKNVRQQAFLVTKHKLLFQELSCSSFSVCQVLSLSIACSSSW